MEKKKKKLSLLPILFVLVCLLIGGGMGYLVGRLTGEHGLVHHMTEGSIGSFLGNYLLLIVLMVVTVYLQLILHEGGHLAAGLVSGYRFVSFRIGSLMLKRTGEGYEWKRLSLAGTGGQCLMSPPEPAEDGSFPFVLYNLGGSLANLITGAAAFVLFLLCRDGRVLPFFLLGLALVGLLFALTNGVPVHTKLITNDGYNAWSMGKDPAALRAFWVQLRINEEQMLGVRLREMPAEWFALPEDADLQNTMISALAVFQENRLMDALDFDGAEAQIALLQSGRCKVIGLYDGLLTLDRVFLDILRRGAAADLSPLSEKQTAALMKQMKKFPSVLRTRYAAALVKHDDKDAAEALRQFEKVRPTYPAPAEAAAEAELIALAKKTLLT